MGQSVIQRTIRIEASPRTVFEVISDPAHVRQWWPDEANYDVCAGSAGQIVFTKDGERHVVQIEVVDAIPYRLFSFRWTHEPGERARAGNSFLVTFELDQDGDATVLRMSESGFDEREWDAARVEATYLDHSTGWDYHLARLAPYVANVVAGAR
jgi:uncharacterized protein YndB with AHSA1/START domain